MAVSVAAVNGITLVKLGGTVQYEVKLTNGAQTILANTPLSLTVDGAAASTPRCNGTSGSSALSSGLGDGAVVLCAFDVTVNATHEELGEIPILSVQAAYSPKEDILYIPPVTIPRWPVYTNATMSSITYAVDTTVVGGYLTSEWCSLPAALAC